jgi:hypothetical protein
MQLLAVEKGHEAIVDLLLEKLEARNWTRIAIGMKDKRGLSALHLGVLRPWFLPKVSHAKPLTWDVKQDGTGLVPLMLAR